MKNILLLVIFVFAMQPTKGNFLVKVDFQYRLLIGHHVTMYYSVDNLDSLFSRIKTLDTFSERNILAMIGLPLNELNNSQESCTVPSDVKVNYEKLFKRNNTRIITYKTRTTHFQMRVLNCDYKLCVFPLTNKYWGSYDVHFKEAGVLMANVKRKKWNNADKKKVEAIRKYLSGATYICQSLY